MKLIYFVPGIMGSKLVNKKTRAPVWSLDMHMLTRALYRDPRSLRADLEATEVIRVADLRVLGLRLRRLPIYGKLLDFLSAIPKSTFIPFPYDWRQSVATTADLLAQDILKKGPVATEIFIVAHSMGGLVAKLAVDRLHETPMSRKAPTVIALGSPFKGSAKAFRTLKYGEPDVHWVLKRWFNLLTVQKVGMANLSPALLREVLTTFQSIYELVPSDEILDYAGQLLHAFDERIPWPQASAPYIRHARGVHKSIARNHTTQMHTIYSFRTPTHVHYGLTDNFEIADVRREGGGDGTVWQGSAQGGPNALRIALEGSPSHEKLPLNDEVHGHLTRLLIQ